jgi:hypothetical protein
MVLAAFAIAAPYATADTVVSVFGEGAGQTFDPNQIALSAADGSLYVADRKNNRVDVFAANGQFSKAIGWGVATGAPTFQTCTTTCRAGIAGSGAGQFSSPTGLAVDNDPTSPSFGSFYVYDSENLRVEKFSPAGTFVLAFGGGVNKTNGSDVCTAASGNLCGAGSSGIEPGEFGLDGLRPLATGLGGAVYVGDSAVVGPEVLANRVQRFESSGTFLSQFPVELGPNARRLRALAVDSKGNAYVSVDAIPSVVKFDPDGALAGTLPGVLGASALAVDAKDDLFAAQRHEGILPGFTITSILELDPTGAPIRDFGYGFPEFAAQGFAAASGLGFDLYASEAAAGEATGSRVLGVSFPPPGPVVVPRPCISSFVGNAKATVQCGLNPEGAPTTVHFQFIDQAGFEAGEFESPDVEETPESASIGEDFKLRAAPLTLEGLEPETTYRYRVVATNTDGAPVFGPTSTFTTKPPLELGPSWSSDVGTASARLNAEVNPLALPTTGFFEYVDDATFQVSGFAAAARAPDVGAGAPPIDFGEGEAFTAGSAELTGLAPKTTYHYRLTASDQFVTVHGPPHTFTTAAEGPLAIADERGFELVSPVDKQSAEAGNPGPAGGLKDTGFTTIQQGSPEGEAFSFTSFTSFGEPQSAPGASQYLAGRTQDGWTTRNVTPPGHGGNPLQPPFRGFSPSLATGAVAVTEPPLTAGADPDHPNLYLEDTATGAFKLLSTGTPAISAAQKDRYCVGFGGMTADGSRALVLANGALTPNAPAGVGFSLYEWSQAGGLRLASLLPGEVPAAPSVHTGFGAEGVGACGLGETIERNAISADGSKVFWTFVPNAGNTRLLARVGGTETVQIDAKQGGTGNAGGGKFRAASTDGSKVFFIAASKLVPGASAGNLYRYDFGQPLGSRLVDLTPGAEAANVQGVLGASDDGSAVYFVATGVLSNQPSPTGDTAGPGADNLYVWRAGQGVAFIATLTVADEGDWSSKPREATARVSPDGSTVAFLSRSPLTGYDNTVEDGEGCVLSDEGELGGEGDACAEVFLYDAGADELVCASCNPRGQRPTGPAALPVWSSPFQQPRYLSADGSRLFFQTLDGLDVHDLNGEVDVYELERAGTGGCTAASPTFATASGGCLFLISGGTDTDPAFLLDSSEDGRDVFFSTRARLVGQDIDERYDVYDARAGGGFAPPDPPGEECAGEACRPGSEGPPVAPPPGSETPTGEGNLHEAHKPPLRCPKGTRKVRRHGKLRCVKVAKKHHRHRASGHGRGGAR